VLLQFRSDHSVADHGFHLSWNTTRPQCGGLVQGLTRGSIMSPGYPGPYPHNADCTWTIRVAYGEAARSPAGQ
jgi:cubilin